MLTYLAPVRANPLAGRTYAQGLTSAEQHGIRLQERLWRWRHTKFRLWLK